MSKIWSLARQAEQPKLHLMNQVIRWSRYEKAVLLALFGVTCAVCGGGIALVLNAPVRAWLGW